MLSWDEGDILETLGASIDRGLLRAAVSSAFTYTFTHALIEAAIYQSVPAADRVVRHRRAAEVLAPVAEGDRSVLASVARHWQLGERPDRAARSYLAAARAALAVYARDEAMALGRRALELSRDARERFDAATTIAEAAEHSPGDESWKSAIDLLRELASSLGAEEQFAAAMVAARHYSKRGDRTAQRAEIDRLLGLSTTLAPNLRANALYYSAMFDFQQGRLAEALTQLSDALELPENDPNTESLVRALLVQVFMRLSRSEEAALHSAALGKLCADSAPAAITMRYVLSKQQIAMETGDAEGARRAGLEMADLAASLGDTYLEAHGRMSIAYGTLRYGSADETRKQLAIGRDLCERIGYAAGVSSLTSAMASCELQLGRAAAALASLDEAIPILERMNAQLALAVAYYTKSQALLLLEDGLAALEAAATCERYAKATGSRNLIAGALETLGIATFRFGDAAAGIEQLEQSVRIRREIGPPARTIESLCALLEALLEAKRDEGVPALAAELEELYDRHADRAWKPTFVLSLLSRAAALRGDDAAAEAYRKRGRAILESDIARLADGEVAAALRSLPYNRLYA
jgi:tetratricopeptide (TPR) repeat protein